MTFPAPSYVEETASVLKATRMIPPDAWEAFVEGWKDPWAGLTMNEVLDDLRGPVALLPDTVP